jgi:hypothetical protein
MDLLPSLREIRDKLGLTSQSLEPMAVEDIYKPALGAVHLKPESAQ